MNLEIESIAEAKVVRVKEPRLIFPLLGVFSAKIMEIIEGGTRHLEEALELLEIGINEAKGKNASLLAQMREIFRMIQLGTSPLVSRIYEKDII